MKKIISLLLSLFILVACTGNKVNNNSNNTNNTSNTSNTNGEYYLNLLKNYEVLDKDPNSTNKDNEEFNDFLNRVFKETIESDYMYMHSSVSDYKAMDLTKPEVTLGDLTYGVNEDDLKAQEDYLNELTSFDYDSLSYSQQIDYDLFKYSLYETLCGYYYSNYTLLFSSDTDLSSNIMTNLVEFSYYDEESLEDYIVILNDVSRYIDDAISYTDAQVKDGIYHTKYMLDEQIEYIDSVAVDEDNTIISSFENAMKEVDFIDDSTKQDYISKVSEIVKNDINPALKKLSNYLSNLRTTSSENVTYYALDPSYAEYKFIVSSSNNGDVETIYSELVDYYNNLVDGYNKFISDQDAIDEFYEIYNNEILNSDYKTQLDYLKNNMDDKYTNIGNVDYVVSELDTLGSSTAAYYVTAPLDNPNQNVIRVNANNTGTDKVSSFEILAHEGFPGHLYQHIMFMKSNPNNFRHTQSFIGYTEGWADLASNDALGLLSDNELVMAYLRTTSVTTQSHIIFSMWTILIHYYGYSLEDFKEVASGFGLDDSYIEEYYNYIVSIGMTYLYYGVGFISHLNIRQEAIDELGDKFSYTSYHDALLENGPVPFVLLKQIVSHYIDENK